MPSSRQQLLPIACATLRQAGQHRQRGAMQTDRLGVRETGRGHLGGPAVVADRTVAASAAHVLLGQLRRHRVGVVGVQQLETLRDPAVQQPAPRRCDVGVGMLAEQVVREVVTVPGLTQDAIAPQLVDGVHHGVGFQIARLGDQVE